jgi:single-strand DNA-binding protein
MSNVFSFAGVCGNDAEVRYLPSGLAVLNVSVANTVGYGEKRQTIWIRVAMFGKPAEGTLKDYLKKGTHVFVSGELTPREYKANDGTMRTSLDLNANVIDLVGKKDGTSSQPQSSYPPATTKPAQFEPAQPSGGHDNFNDAPYDDDIPF